MKKIKWENILLFFLELLVNMATVGVAILLNALIDAAQISITSGNTYYLQKTLLISILYAVCLGILIFLSNRYKACYIRKCLLEMRNILARGTLQANISDYENTGNASYVTTFNQNFSIIEESAAKPYFHLRLCHLYCICCYSPFIHESHYCCCFHYSYVNTQLIAKFFQ